MKFGRIEDIAVDRAHGLYLLDTGLKRLYISHVRASSDGKVGLSLSGWLAVPQEGDRATKNPRPTLPGHRRSWSQHWSQAR